MSGPSDPQKYIDLDKLVEPIIAAFKDEIGNVDGIDVINEGEAGYTKATEVWVVPGQMRPEMSSMSSMKWRATIYVILANSEEGSTLPELRQKAYQVFNELAKDTTHRGTAWVTFPRLFHPGYMTDGAVTFVGVLMVYEVEFYQKFINDAP